VSESCPPHEGYAKDLFWPMRTVKNYNEIYVYLNNHNLFTISLGVVES
jgi:hypothetical protein